MNFIIHYKVSFQSQSIEGVTTIRNAANSTAAGLILMEMIRKTAPETTIEITGTKEVSNEDLNNFFKIIRIQ